MIVVQDDINTRWWGEPVGRVDDPGFFALDPAERAAALEPFAWAEFRSPLDSSPDPWALAATGFAFCDVQVNFKLRLRPVPEGASAAALEVTAADQQRFDPLDRPLKPFTRERFARLRGATQERVDDRFVRWARQLLDEHPELALQIASGGEPQGWYCSRPLGSGINLTLAALYEGATISGLHLYEAAIGAYAERGFRIGSASFSITNGDAHGIYAGLGARFTSPVGFWLWQPA